MLVLVALGGTAVVGLIVTVAVKVGGAFVGVSDEVIVGVAVGASLVVDCTATLLAVSISAVAVIVTLAVSVGTLVAVIEEVTDGCVVALGGAGVTEGRSASVPIEIVGVLVAD